MTPEGIVKKQVCEYLDLIRPHIIHFWIQESVGIWDEKKRTFRKKNSKYQINGIADICMVYRGLPVYFECKAPGSSRMSDAQKMFCKRITEVGAYYFVVRCLEDAIKAIFEINKDPRCFSAESANP